MAEPTIKTTKTIEIEMNMQNLSDQNDWKTKTLSMPNPDTTAGGLSAIADFRDFLLTATTINGEPGLVPAWFFQPDDGDSSTFYATKSTTAYIVETTKTTTPLD